MIRYVSSYSIGIVDQLVQLFPGEQLLFIASLYLSLILSLLITFHLYLIVIERGLLWGFWVLRLGIIRFT